MFTEFCTCDSSNFTSSGCICGSQEKNITLGMLKMLMIECAKNWQDLRSPIVNRRIHPDVKDEMLHQALLTAFHLTMMETGMDGYEVNQKDEKAHELACQYFAERYCQQSDEYNHANLAHATTYN